MGKIFFFNALEKTGYFTIIVISFPLCSRNRPIYTINKLLSIGNLESTIEGKVTIYTAGDFEDVLEVEQELFDDTRVGKLRLSNTTAKYINDNKFLTSKKKLLPLFIIVIAIIILLQARG